MPILNLLPYKAREDLKHRISAEVLLFGVFLAGVMILDAIMLLSVDASMKLTLYQLKGEIQTVDTDRGFHPIQSDMNVLSGLQHRYVFSAQRLADLAQRRPDGLDITELQMTASDGRISLKGTARSADLVDKMKDALERSGEFYGSSVFLQDLAADDSVRFTLETHATLSKL